MRYIMELIMVAEKLALIIGVAAVLCNVLFVFRAEDGIRVDLVTGVQTCALPIYDSQSGPETVDERRRRDRPEGRAVACRDRIRMPVPARVDRQIVCEIGGWSVHIDEGQPQIGRASCRERVELTEGAEPVTTENTR